MGWANRVDIMRSALRPNPVRWLAVPALLLLVGNRPAPPTIRKAFQAKKSEMLRFPDYAREDMLSAWVEPLGRP